MTTDEAKRVYEKVFTAFPQVREWLAKTENPKGTYAVWCAVLAGVEFTDADTAVDGMILGDTETPEAYERERWPQVIRSIASTIRSVRFERKRMHKYHATATEARTVNEKFTIAMRESSRLGELVRDGELSSEENKLKVESLVAWSERGGPIPEWLEKEN